METFMSGVAPAQHSKWSARRISLLAGVAGLSAAVFFSAPGLFQNSGMPTAAFAQDVSKEASRVARPVGFADIVEKVKPAVISVRVRMTADSSNVLGDDLPFPKGSPMDRFFRRFGMPDNVLPHNDRPRRRNFVTGQGSGFFISADGYAVTNNHVVDKAEKVQVTTDNGKTYTAKVIGTDPRTDVALIKVEGGSNFPYVHFASGHPRIGDWVLAVGNPFGLGGTVTAGIVSARGRDIGAGPYDDFIQIDAPVNRGNSGGPTFDVDGNVIGVNTAIFSPSGGSVGIAFAIPSETVQSVVAQLKDKGAVTRGWIGVQIQPVTAEIAESLGMKDAHGAIVAQPQDNSPAVKAGIQAGDVIVNVNGHKVKDARDLAKQIGGMSPGTSVKLDILRDGKQKNITLTLGRMPNERQASNQTSPSSSDDEGADVPKLGLTLAPASEVAGSGKEGVVVTDVAPDGVAAEHGFKTGDVIVEVAGKKVTNPKDVRSAISAAQKNGKRTVLLRVKSSEGMKFVALRIGNA
jgi:serine protease Do